MARAAGHPDTDLIALRKQLEQDPDHYTFTQVIRLLRVILKRTAPPISGKEFWELVRVRPHLGLEFPHMDLSSLTWGDDGQTALLEVNFFGINAEEVHFQKRRLSIVAPREGTQVHVGEFQPQVRSHPDQFPEFLPGNGRSGPFQNHPEKADHLGEGVVVRILFQLFSEGDQISVWVPSRSGHVSSSPVSRSSISTRVNELIVE